MTEYFVNNIKERIATGLSIVADKDGVLSESHCAIVPVQEINDIVAYGARFTIITGASIDRVQQEIIAPLSDQIEKTQLKQIDLVVNNGAGIYRHDGTNYVNVYQSNIEEHIGKHKKDIVLAILRKTKSKFSEITSISNQYPEIKQICDEHIQIVLRVLGKIDDPEKRKSFDPDGKKRTIWAKYIQDRFLNEQIDLSVDVAGTSSINIRVPGIHKGSGIKKLAELRKEDPASIVYIGDAFAAGQNDRSAVEDIIELAVNVGDNIGDSIEGTTVIDIPTKGIEGTRSVLTEIKDILSMLET